MILGLKGLTTLSSTSRVLKVSRFLGREAAKQETKSREVPRHIKSDEGLFGKSKLHIPSVITFYKSVGNTTTNKQIKTTKSKKQLSPVHSKLMLPWKLSLVRWVDEPSPSSLLILEYLAKHNVTDRAQRTVHL